MAFTRAEPSPRYRYLISQYISTHQNGEVQTGIPADRVFPGQSLFPQLHRIKQFIDLTKARTLLDYGCGKGMQYNPLSTPFAGLQAGDTVMDYWDIDNVHCYDPCVTEFTNLPRDQFDGVISTDVLEHCPEEDLPWIVDEIFSFATRFVFANVACFPAKKRLPDGENAHCTIKDADWWIELVSGVAARYPHLRWSFWIQYRKDLADPTSKMVETQIGNTALAA